MGALRQLDICLENNEKLYLLIINMGITGWYWKSILE